MLHLFNLTPSIHASSLALWMAMLIGQPDHRLDPDFKYLLNCLMDCCEIRINTFMSPSEGTVITSTSDVI